MNMKIFAIIRLYCGKSGSKGFYNSQEIGLAKAMRKLGYRCVVFYPDIYNAVVSEDIVCNGIKIINVPAKNIGNHSKFNWNILKEYNVDVAEIESDNQIFAPELLNFCDKNEILAFSYIGITNTDSKNGFKQSLMKFLFRKNVNIYRQHMNFAKTEKAKQELNNWGIDRVAVAPVGLDISIIPEVKRTRDEIREEHEIPVDDKVIIFVGRLDEYKRPEFMLDLINSLPEKFYGIIIGDGEKTESIDAKINQLKLNRRIKHIKRIPNEEMHQYYKMADYFVNFNDHEIFGMSILEAMYQGCNVIAFHAPGPDEIIENKKNGFLVNSLDEMKALIMSGHCASSDYIKRRVKDYFTWTTTANIFDEWIREQER